MKIIKKILIGIASTLLALVFVVALGIWAIWGNEISSLASFTMVRDRNDAHLDGAVYTMHVKGGFYLDDFVEQGGVKSDKELINFVTEKITKGLIPMKDRKSVV